MNNGSSNNISSLDSIVSVFSNLKSSFKTAANPNPFSKLTNLKKLWLNGDNNKNFDYHDLTPLSVLAALQPLDVSDTRES